MTENEILEIFRTHSALLEGHFDASGYTDYPTYEEVEADQAEVA